MSDRKTDQRPPLLGGLVTAIRMLTILPVPGRNAPKAASSLYWFPVVGLLLGALVTALSCGFARLPVRFPPYMVALPLLAVSALLTRAFHLDGLADWADGWWGGYDRERILEIMKDSHIGTFGVVALVLALLGKLLCYTHLLAQGQPEWIGVSFVLSRMGMVDLAVAQPYARTGPGTGSSVVHQAHLRHGLIAAGLAAAILLAWPGLSWQHAGIALLAALLIARLFGARCRQRIGGVTGDTLGAGNELIELAILALGVILNTA